MRNTAIALFLVGAFVLGFVASQWLVPPAQAQDEGPPRFVLMRWEYLCIDKLDRARLNQAGLQGWELVTGAPRGSGNAFTQSQETMVWCFKRPLF